MDWIDPGAPALNGKPDWYSKIFAVSQALSQPDMEHKIIINGLCSAGEVVLIGGPAKSWKSWAQMDMSYCISNGFGWLAWPEVERGKVLHIDLEIFKDHIGSRFQQIADSYGKGSFDNIEVLSLRGYNWTLNDFSSLADHLSPDDYSLICVDPCYRLLAGLNESDSGVITDLMNRAYWVAERLRCAIVLLQHFSKGSQSDKRAIDAFSGSGVWGRAPDACLAFREHADEKCFTVTSDIRHNNYLPDFVVEFNFPRFKLQANKDPEDLKRPKLGRHISFTVENLCNLIGDAEYISNSDLLRRCQAAGVSKSSFIRRLKDAKFNGWLATNPTDATYFLTSTYLDKFRPKNQ